MEEIRFPDSFIFGAATAAYQIEGAWNIDGKGESIWDRFSHTPKKIKDGTNGDIACDHYNRYKEDVMLMKELNLQAYRLSIAWTRIYPDGFVKDPNQKGLDFYKRLLELLLENNIKPFITLYHWDLPQKLQDIGGWYNRDITEIFSDYCYSITNYLKEYTNYFVTMNEPLIFWAMGHIFGEHAPGYKNIFKAIEAVNNILLSHGKAVKKMRGISDDLKIGIVNALWPCYPLNDKHKKAAEKGNDYNLRLFLDPIYKSNYPGIFNTLIRLFSKNDIDEDLKIISTPIDFLGVNHYSRTIVKNAFNIQGFKSVKPSYKGVEFTDMGWEVYPEAFYELLKWIKEEYNNPIVYITENGAAYKDELKGDVIDDKDRISYYKRYLKELSKAIEDGCDIRGYFAWSLMDNFEWAEGLSKRFGLIYIDYNNNQKRIIKESGKFYRDLCKNKSFYI